MLAALNTSSEKGTDTGTADRGALAWLVCAAAGCLCALPVESVSEVMRPLPIEPLSGTPPFARGLCVIRGTPLPVIDAGVLLVGRSIAPARLVTLTVGTRAVALAVESVIGVRWIDPESMSRLPPLLSNASGNAVEALRALDGELLLLLDTARLVPDAVLDELTAAGSRA